MFEAVLQKVLLLQELTDDDWVLLKKKNRSAISVVADYRAYMGKLTVKGNINEEAMLEDFALFDECSMNLDTHAEDGRKAQRTLRREFNEQEMPDAQSGRGARRVCAKYS